MCGVTSSCTSAVSSGHLLSIETFCSIQIFCLRENTQIRPWGEGGQRGEWGGGRVTSCIWHRMDVRAEWPPFSALPSIWLAPFSAKSIWLAPFFWISIWKAPLFCCIPVHAYNFRTEIFEATCSLGIQWIDCYICLPAINGYKKIKGQYMNGSTFQTIWYMNGSVLSKARYMIGGKFWNTGSYTRTTITPKLPLEDQTTWIRRVIWAFAVRICP